MAPLRRSRRQARLPAATGFATRHPYQIAKDNQTSMINSRWPNPSPRRRTRAPRPIHNTNSRCYQLAALHTLAHLPKFMEWAMMHNTPSHPCLGPGVRVETVNENLGEGVQPSRQTKPGSTDQGKDARGKHFSICPACALKKFLEYYWSDQDLETSGNPPRDPRPIPSNHPVIDFLNLVDHRFETRQDSPEVFFYFLKELLEACTSSTPGNLSQWAMMHRALTNLELQSYRSCSNIACRRNTTPHLGPEERDLQGFIALGIDETKKTRGTRDTLQASLYRYLVNQELPDYKCAECDQKDTNTETRRILAAPDILRIYLGLGGFRNGQSYKITDRIDIPERLNLTQYQVDQSTPLRYRLSSVINHTGATIQGGHYIATVKGPGDVYVINDHEKLSCGPNNQKPADKSRLLCRNPQKWAAYDENRKKRVTLPDDYQAFVLTYVRVPNKELEKLEDGR